MDKRYQVFVSSTFDDLKSERKKIWETLVSFNYIVAGMESFPAADDEQFSYIRKQIESSDYYVLILSNRYGSLASDGLGFTEKEFDFALSISIPILAFLIRDPDSVSVSKTDKDMDKGKLLALFRSKVCSDRIVTFWSDENELALGVIKALRAAEETHPRDGWIRGNFAPNTKLLSELRVAHNEIERLRLRIAKESKSNDQKIVDYEVALPIKYKIGEKNKEIEVKVIDVIKQFALTEPIDLETISDCVSGAISVLVNKSFDDIEINTIEADKFVMILSSMGIINLRPSALGLIPEHGANWLNAHAAARAIGA